jgi:predicted metal-dependent phosphoesterase TrpH
MPIKPADLHVHSTFSDGSQTPEELIKIALSAHVEVIALCDHDTTLGVREFLASAKKTGIRAIGGVEISAIWPRGSCHIVGLGVPCENPLLDSKLSAIRQGRFERNDKIALKLKEMGIDIEFDKLKRSITADSLGRNHIAVAMVEKGFVSNTQAAFDLYLAKGKPAYVQRFQLSPEEAVQTLKTVGSQPILAHPSLLKIDHDTLESLVGRLKAAGLEGIEAYTPYATSEDIAIALSIAKKYSLFVSGGSDFHGSSKPNHRLGFYSETDRIMLDFPENFDTIYE